MKPYLIPSEFHKYSTIPLTSPPAPSFLALLVAGTARFPSECRCMRALSFSPRRMDECQHCEQILSECSQPQENDPPTQLDEPQLPVLQRWQHQLAGWQLEYHRWHHQRSGWQLRLDSERYHLVGRQGELDGELQQQHMEVRWQRDLVDIGRQERLGEEQGHLDEWQQRLDRWQWELVEWQRQLDEWQLQLNDWQKQLNRWQRQIT